jgi:hypothetical protein
MWFEWRKETDEGYEKGEQIARTLLADINLPLMYRARAYMILGSTPSVFWAKEGVRTVERGIQAMRDNGKAPGAAELRLLADCQNVIEQVEAAEEDDEGDEDEEDGHGEEEPKKEEGDVVQAPESGLSDGTPDGIRGGERVMASIEPASANVSTLSVQKGARSGGVNISSFSRTASADVPTLLERLRVLRDQIRTDQDFGDRFVHDPMVGELLGDALVLAKEEGKEEQGEEAYDKLVALLRDAECRLGYGDVEGFKECGLIVRFDYYRSKRCTNDRS